MVPSRVRVAVALVIGLTTGAANCLLEEPDPDQHEWGRYQLCLEKRFDSCESGDAGCPAVMRDDTRAASFRVNKVTGVLQVSRSSVDAGVGIQGGARFELVGTPTRIDAQCGCRMVATETIQGEFVVAPATCTGASDAGAGCVTEGVARDAGWVPGVLEGFVDPLAAIDLDTLYEGVQGRVVVSLVPEADAGACRCGPCRIEYELRGRR